MALPKCECCWGDPKPAIWIVQWSQAKDDHTMIYSALACSDCECDIESAYQLEGLNLITELTEG